MTSGGNNFNYFPKNKLHGQIWYNLNNEGKSGPKWHIPSHFEHWAQGQSRSQGQG